MMYKRTSSKGFTLVELIVVVTILGVVATIVVPRLNGNSVKAAKAVRYYTDCQGMARSWGLLATKMGTSTAIPGSVIPDPTPPAKNALDVIVGGPAYTNAAYNGPSSYEQVGLAPLTTLTGTPGSGSYSVDGHALTLTSIPMPSTTDSHYLACSYAGVADSITAALVQDYGSKANPLAASDTTNTSIRYSAADATGSRTLTILVPM